MQYAAHLPRVPSTRVVVAPIVALVVGAAAATGAYALIDNGDDGIETAKVIVVETPAPGAAKVAGKDEAATAAAITPSSSGSAETSGPNEAATAAEITPSSGGSAETSGPNEAATAAAVSASTGGLDLRGSKASAPSDDSQSGASAELSNRTDPHGVASTLHVR